MPVVAAAAVHSLAQQVRLVLAAQVATAVHQIQVALAVSVSSIQFLVHLSATQVVAVLLEITHHSLVVLLLKVAVLQVIQMDLMEQPIEAAVLVAVMPTVQELA